MERHDGVTIEFEAIPAGYSDKILASFAAGAVPDVFLLDSPYVPRFVNRDLLLDLRPTADTLGLDLDAFFPTVRQIFEKDGALYALPKDFTPIVMYYNKRLFDAAGVAYPEPGWTWQEYLEIAQQLTRDGNTERIEQDVKQIRGAASTMQRLLEELLELSRIGRLMNPPEHVSLTDLAHEAAARVAGQLDQRGCVVTIAPAMPTVYGDRTRLLEIFQNLLDNAVKFMGEQPEPRIEIDAAVHDAEAVCTVRDNGMGIAPQYHEKIFGLFERLHQHFDGTGIGLTLVKRIVEVHGGRIEVASEGEGRSSTFTFRLPVG